MRLLRYIDAMVFVYAALGEGRLAQGAVRHLRGLVEGDAPGITSALTVDEVVWVLAREGARELALAEGGRMLSLPNLRVLPATADTMRSALELMERVPTLRPRDAVHAATAIEAGVFAIVSDDPGFDRVPGLEREPLA